jgi:Protein of unknown function (DUF2815)
MPSKTKKIAVMLPPGIGSYMTVFEPRAVDPASKPKYGLSILYGKASLPLMVTRLDTKKSVTLQSVIDEVGKDFFGAAWGVDPKIRVLVKDGDVERPQDAVYKGKVFIAMNSERKPTLVDAQNNQVFTPDEIYSGCLVRAQATVAAYQMAVNKGVTLYVNGVQVLKKLEPIAGTVVQFDPVAVDETDPLG